MPAFNFKIQLQKSGTHEVIIQSWNHRKTAEVSRLSQRWTFILPFFTALDPPKLDRSKWLNRCSRRLDTIDCPSDILMFTFPRSRKLLYRALVSKTLKKLTILFDSYLDVFTAASPFVDSRLYYILLYLDTRSSTELYAAYRNSNVASYVVRANPQPVVA